MNYAAAAKAIRQERRAIWEALGKPATPIPPLPKSRQLGFGTSMIFAHINALMFGPWREFNQEKLWHENPWNTQP